MGVFDRFERRIEGAVNGVFARAFKGDVQPVEIAARLQRELDAEAKLMSRDRRLVPNEFVVRLSRHDYDRLAPYGKTLMNELLPELKQHAQDMGYVFSGPIMIHLELDDTLPTGRFAVSSSAVEPPDGRTPAASQPGVRTSQVRGRLVLEVNGMRHPLRPPGLVIGRGTDADLRINDPGISRRHAQLRVTPRGGDLDIEIVDLGSTNGVVVDGRRVQQAWVGEGSRIEIGNTRMLVHTPAEA
ncbi:DUF3662 and FHA domain-containing protein [Microlunatus sp. Gsoil 973]|uniref:FhaA domain-containing protein n=1 Tax=Microlunatus sp. Gsoil 973 TaxID=2672569 RepID=UPI0012B49A0B|nr:DUF3662 and FHA domain-containing protein [Microlunatus sp. Gsoil 973]QGN34146.1 DUF3662 domain-containing protein [Microlunatus sp. Gsoil 973]